LVATREIESVEFAICHSNSNPFEGIRNFSTRIVTSIHKPERKGALKKLYGTIGKKGERRLKGKKFRKNGCEDRNAFVRIKQFSYISLTKLFTQMKGLLITNAF